VLGAAEAEGKSVSAVPRARCSPASQAAKR